MDGPRLRVTMLNRKGGVGKTTTCQHISGALAKLGRQVLLVDLDPQANLTQGILGPQGTEAIPPSKSVVSLFDDRYDPDPEQVIMPTQTAGVFLLPGAEALEDLDIPRPQEQGEYQFALRRFIKEVDHIFDVILIDCQPSLGLLSWNGIMASTSLCVPFQAEDYGSQGITRVQKFFDLALQTGNPGLRLIGYLLTMYDKRLAVHKAFDLALRNLYGSDVFSTYVPLSTHFKEATSARVPVTTYKARCAASKSMHALASEMLGRAETLADTPPRFLYAGNRTSTPFNQDDQQPLDKAG